MNKFRTWLYNLLLRNYRFKNSKLYDRLLRYAMNPPTSINTRIHERIVSIPSNYSYPFVARNHLSFNNPFLELVHQTHQAKGRKLCIVDVGAAVGDTFLFLKSNVPHAIEAMYCIEGSDYFFPYLEKNTANEPEVVRLNVLLSDTEKDIPALIHHHGSSAMAAGETKVPATTLDSLFASKQMPSIDVLKIDVDGFDGRVLCGASFILSEKKPATIFEFHPALINQTRNDVELPFHTLAVCGYKLLLWFDKFGNFSHSSSLSDAKLFLEVAEKSLNGFYGQDWHYDIVALPYPDQYNLESLKNCSFALTKPSPW